MALLEFGGHGQMYTPGLRPEGPSGKNQHLFPHHGLYGKYGGGKPKAPNTSPYPDKDSDLKTGDIAAEMKPDVEELPLEEFFKFTKSANDNTSYYRPPTYGGGAPAAYGKSSKEFGSYDPTTDEKSDDEDLTIYGEDPKAEEKKQSIKGRSSSKVGVFEEVEADLQEYGAQARYRHPRADSDYSTKQPWASGIPGYDKKDIINGDAKIDELTTDLEREEENDGKSSIEEMLIREFTRGAPGQHAKRGWADSSWSNMNYPKTSKTPVSDLRFWEILSRDNIYMMTGLDEFEDEQKENADNADKEDEDS